ncbi:hypothetical protein M404DRAFT_27499 [Pisolithus tinctorius Marx 270]|uniref:CCHC-type domain-containing protein n=1 Tax=Pisolithus tinctorius Marx 270 TaxID=870435 RepID=A0A0C3JZV6_PISTI|nr:hypothetical protein M404DRAFT_27499 [Pisolithus tinctorius Marx 270]
MATKTCFQPPCSCSATNPDSASASGAHCKTALAALGTTRCSPDPVSSFRGFSAQTSNTPTPCCPIAPIPSDDPGDEGPGDNDDNNPDDDDPSNDENGLEDKPDFPDLDTKPAVAVFDSLTKAIKLLACNTCTGPESSSRTKLHEPDTFDGTDPKKLCAFFIQCKLNFQDQPWAFRTDCAKVIFTQSYLKELQTTFGPHDPVADTESQLDHLYMKDSQCINKYIVDFNWLALQVQGYRDGALHHHFYSRLPDWIKDEVCQVGKPQTLHELCHLAQEIDVHYWEHKEEIQWASKHQGASTSNKCNGPASNNQSETGQNKAKTSSNNNSRSSPKPGNNNNSNSSKPKPSKLRKDGKLTPEECKHHIDGNLCMFCGESGHFADKCPKKASKAKAHAAVTTEAAPALGSGSTPKTKK